jgi:hypothetical protein
MYFAQGSERDLAAVSLRNEFTGISAGDFLRWWVGLLTFVSAKEMADQQRASDTSRNTNGGYHQVSPPGCCRHGAQERPFRGSGVVWGGGDGGDGQDDNSHRGRQEYVLSSTFAFFKEATPLG